MSKYPNSHPPSPVAHRQTSTTHLRVVNAIKDGPNVDVFLIGIPLVENLSSLEVTSYNTVSRGRRQVCVVKSECRTPILEEWIDIREGQRHTLTLMGTVCHPESFSLALFCDKNECPKPGTANLRFINSAPYLKHLDLYLDDKKIFTNVYVGQTGIPAYIPVCLGAVNITLKRTGSCETLVCYDKAFLVSGGIYTVFSYDDCTLIFTHDNPECCEQLQPHFNLQEYMGLWYQIANIPSYFDSQCVRSTATYTSLNSYVKVYNVCHDAHWHKVADITGRAVAIHKAAFRVDFPKPPVPIIYGPRKDIPECIPNYLVHYTDYCTYSVVGTPDRSLLFILARHKNIPESLYKDLLKRAIRLGYDPSKVVVNFKAVKAQCYKGK